MKRIRYIKYVIGINVITELSDFEEEIMYQHDIIIETKNKKLYFFQFSSKNKTIESDDLFNNFKITNNLR